MPYNPGVQSRTADYIFQGLSNMGASLGRGMAQGAETMLDVSEKKKRDKEYLDAFEMMRETDPEFGKKFGDKSAYELGVNGVRAIMQGEQQMLSRQAFDAGRKQQDDLEKQNKQLRKIVKGDPNAPSWAKEMADGDALTVQNFGQLAEIHGMMNPESIPYESITDEVTGHRFMARGATMLPSGVDSAVAAGGAASQKFEVGATKPVAEMPGVFMVYDGTKWNIEKSGKEPISPDEAIRLVQMGIWDAAKAQQAIGGGAAPAAAAAPGAPQSTAEFFGGMFGGK